MHRPESEVTALDARLVEGLLRAEASGHDAEHIELVETHISWVILAGDFAYKIKKPIVLDFLDFGTLEKRKHCCEEEIRLNQPWAPDIYLDVVAITGTPESPRLGGDGEAIEYAVRMRRFDQSLRLDAQLEAGLLTVVDMKELGRNIAERHSAADVARPGERDRLLERTRFYIRENFRHLRGVIEDDQFNFLQDWTGRELARLGNTLDRRFDNGFVRDCHGDLHLGNLVRLPTGITTFDCIEFNPDLRYSDLFADVAFLAMDLVERGRHDLASHFVNRYLESTGDYAGMAVFDLYFVYRCLVRAKVAAIRSHEREEESERLGDAREARDYCDMARRQATRRKCGLVIMSGVSGSGKSWLSERIMAELPAVRLRSDIERKRLHGLAASDRSSSGIGTGLYSSDAREATYERLFELAIIVLEAGHHVILDAAFLKSGQRTRGREVARDAGCRSILLRVVAPGEVLRERIRARGTKSVSEAGVAVLEHQLDTEDTPTEVEQAVVIDNRSQPDVAEVVAQIRRRLRDGP
jgi:aminoglycoside phosphotransferase family enzyme/predicted kinase